jgi:hypothetical protein
MNFNIIMYEDRFFNDLFNSGFEELINSIYT